MMRIGEKGFTLFEILVAVLLLAMVSSMIYSIMNVSIRFSEKGERGVLMLEREQGLLGLLQRQIESAWYDELKKQVRISADEDILRLVTRAPLLYPQAGVVLAVYRYDEAEATLYYQEKRDYYNSDYDDEYVPEYDTMIRLLENDGPLLFTYPEDALAVTVAYRDTEYEYTPWCQTRLDIDVQP